MGEALTLVLPLPPSDFFAELSTLFHWATRHSHVYHLKPERAIIPLEKLQSHLHSICAQLTFSPCNTPWILTLQPHKTYVPLKYSLLLVDISGGKFYIYHSKTQLNIFIKDLRKKFSSYISNTLGKISESIVPILWGTMSINKGNIF